MGRVSVNHMCQSFVHIDTRRQALPVREPDLLQPRAPKPQAKRCCFTSHGIPINQSSRLSDSIGWLWQIVDILGRPCREQPYLL